MLKILPKKGWLLSVFLCLSAFGPATLLAQQEQLKTEAIEPQAVHETTGHNNLRKLAKIYDKSVREAQGQPAPVGDDAQLRRLYEIELLKDPHTGLIPEGIRQKELAFVERMNARLGNSASREKSNARIIENWKPRGPFNVGGRTRALALDIDNENIILAGGVSGGMWRSEDGGLTWYKTTGTSELQSVTAIAQDPRPGHRNVWYYATGERIGNSASASGAFFSGNGIYKSTDGGRSWSILPATADNKPQINAPFDLIFNIAVHPTTGDIYAATWWGIHRSADGGASFTEVIAGGADVWTDILVTPAGVLYATLDSDGVPNKGILRSTDGTSWTNITPSTAAGFPTVWGRAVTGYTPTDENIVYAYIDNGTGNGGAFLWRYTHGAATPWTNLSGNTPAFGGSVGNLNTQGGYNMLVKVHPSNPNIVFLGATNLYRSPNGFTSRTGMAWIGGYSPANNVSVYPNQHPDHHVLLFYPSNPLKALSATDGGLHYTDNILTSNAGNQPVVWVSRNNGYLTTQPYTLSLNSTGDLLLAGFQDNGTWSPNNTTLTSPWVETFSGDGSYNSFADGGLSRYVSSQSGNIYRLNYAGAQDPSNAYTSFTRVTPTGATGLSFVAPFILDPNNDNIMYLPAGNRVWRNDNLDAIPLFSNAPTAVNWTSLANSQVPTNNTVSALAVSRVPANRLYYGTNRGLIFRIDNANIGDQPTVDIATGKGLPVGNVICITVDPVNADRVFAVFSNYNIPSVFYSDNGGGTWTNISTNLEENADGTGSGPSVRWLAIEGNNDKYLLGTSTGLYSTTTINGASTVWTQEDPAGMGNVVVPMIRTREDGLAAIATHGNGVYSGKFEVTPIPAPSLRVARPLDDYEVFMNAPSTIIDVSGVFQSTSGSPLTYSLIVTDPSIVNATIEGSLVTVTYAPNTVGRGTVGVVASTGTESVSEGFSVTIRKLEYTLYNQNTAIAGSRPSQLFTNFSNALAQSADDFIIPEGQTWTIEKVFASGAVNGTPVLNSMFVLVYKDEAGVPGQLVYNSGSLVPTSGTSNPSVELTLATPAVLQAGKYWLSVYAQLAFVGGSQWFWRTTSVVTGSQGLFKDPANLFGRGALNWTQQSVAFGGAPTDMLFTFFGKGLGIPAPEAPTNLNASYVNDYTFNVTWSDNSASEQAFLLERSTDGVTFATRTILAPNKTSFSDTESFDRNLTYYYRIAAIGISDTSEFSNVDSTAVIPEPPVAKLASFVTPYFFIANWNASEGTKYYELDVSSDDFRTFLPGYEDKMVTGTSVVVYGTRFLEKYKYRVRAVNAGGESDNSNVIIVAPVRTLTLAAVCSDNPDVVRRWKITNPNPFDIEVQYGLYRSSQSGTMIAPPGDSYFTTLTEKGSNLGVITWRDDLQISRIDVRASTKAKCSGTGLDIAVARVDYESASVETESPFIIDLWPNPATEKINIMIASPLEDEVDLEIFGINGQRVFSTKAQSNVVVEVDATSYIAGTYLVKAKQRLYEKTLRVIKK
ncbi:MAG TPA: T9SS type A sorting domain-containing protein [Chryseosolibacter sp.]